ncbi:hypothetical protein EDC04DRAFT_281051 [Pisolithus marmoratus]|nr:hypothetical protein EDC04DRAFT_281051 [Pisolithus marmoratus]
MPRLLRSSLAFRWFRSRAMKDDAAVPKVPAPIEAPQPVHADALITVSVGTTDKIDNTNAIGGRGSECKTSPSALSRVFSDVVVVTKTPDDVATTIYQWISSYESGKASALPPDEWCNEATLGLAHEDSQQLVRAAIGIAILDEKARNRRPATAADLAFIWALLHSAITHEMTTGPRFSTAQSFQGFLSIALGLKDASVLSLRDSESSMRFCDPAGVTPAALVNMVETVRLWELLVKQGQQHSECAELDHALQAFNKAMNLCESVPDLSSAARYKQQVFGRIENMIRRFERYDLTRVILDKTLAEIEPDSPERVNGWIADCTKTGVMALEHVGGEAFGSLKHDDATTHISTVLSLSPLSPACLLINCRSARAAKGLCDDTLQDANEVVKAGSFPWSYEAMRVALHGAKQYDDAIDAFKPMLEVIERSHGPAITSANQEFT